MVRNPTGPSNGGSRSDLAGVGCLAAASWCIAGEKAGALLGNICTPMPLDIAFNIGSTCGDDKLPLGGLSSSFCGPVPKNCADCRANLPSLGRLRSADRRQGRQGLSAHPGGVACPMGRCGERRGPCPQAGRGGQIQAPQGKVGGETAC